MYHAFGIGALSKRGMSDILSTHAKVIKNIKFKRQIIQSITEHDLPNILQNKTYITLKGMANRTLYGEWIYEHSMKQKNKSEKLNFSLTGLIFSRITSFRQST